MTKAEISKVKEVKPVIQQTQEDENMEEIKNDSRHIEFKEFFDEILPFKDKA